MAQLPDLGTAYRYHPAPDDGDDGTTLLVLPHAGAADDAVVALGRRVAPDAAVLCPRPAGDPAEANAEAAHARAGELAAFLTAATEALDRPGDQVWGFGYSAGASDVVALALDHPDALAGALLISGRLPFPFPGGKVLDGKKVFCGRGRADEQVTIDDYEELVESLVTAGAEVQLYWYDAGHDITDAELDDAREWLRKRRGGS